MHRHRGVMRASVLDLFPSFYDQRQTASAAVHIAHIDMQLIEDGTYFVHERTMRSSRAGVGVDATSFTPGRMRRGDDDRLLDPEPNRLACEPCSSVVTGPARAWPSDPRLVPTRRVSGGVQDARARCNASRRAAVPTLRVPGHRTIHVDDAGRSVARGCSDGAFGRASQARRLAAIPSIGCPSSTERFGPPSRSPRSRSSRG